MSRADGRMRATAGQIVRHARKACGVTQVKLAKRAGISNSYLSDFERGKVGVRFKTFVTLLDELGFGVDIRLVEKDQDDV